MSVTAPIDVELEHEEIHPMDELVIIEQPPLPVATAPRVQRDPVMPFVYVGLLSLLAIIATAAYLAF